MRQAHEGRNFVHQLQALLDQRSVRLILLDAEECASEPSGDGERSTTTRKCVEDAVPKPSRGHDAALGYALYPVAQVQPERTRRVQDAAKLGEDEHEVLDVPVDARLQADLPEPRCAS